MSDISLTAADIRPLNGAVTRRGTAGATLTPGQVVYLDGTNGWKPADASAAASAKARGIVVSDGYGSVSFASGQAVDIVMFGPIAGFLAMTPGASLYVSETAGALNTAAPSTASAAVVPMGWAESAVIFFVDALDLVPAGAIASLTDNSGGTANDTLTALGGITTLTDSTGYSATHDDTLAATTVPTTLTDSTGLSATHDDTLAATSVPTDLTDSSGYSGTHDDTLAATTVPAVLTENTAAIGGVNDGDLPALVDPNGDAGATVIAGIRENATKINAILAFEAVLAQNASDIAQKVKEHNALLTVMAQNASDNAQKVIEHNTLLAVIAQNASDTGQKVIELVADMDDAKNNFADVAAKINAIIAALESTGVSVIV